MACAEIARTSRLRATYRSACFAMVFTTGFYCDSRAHNQGGRGGGLLIMLNVRRVRNVAVSDSYSAASLVCAMIDGKVYASSRCVNGMKEEKREAKRP